MRPQLTAELAASFAKIALSHVLREYPGKMDHVVSAPADIQSRCALHPAFYGSFDWHSCVHGFWLLARILRLYPDLPQAPDVGRLFDQQLSRDKIVAELGFFDRPMQGNFERPYGWAWLLMLSSEMAQHQTAQSKIWHDHLQPLAHALAQRLTTYLAKLPYPIRAGTHPNTAFAAALALEYGEVCRDKELVETVRARVKEFFGSDTDCRPFEPSGNDFHSPSLIEMECMRRALPQSDFLDWLGRFLPSLAERQPKVLFEPVAVPDRADPQIVHLDGLNLSRAWCWRMLCDALPDGDRRKTHASESVQLHLAESLPHIADDYMGEHWLATFAMLALSG
jgi:Protein of unknown function (DUF2891)